MSYLTWEGISIGGFGLFTFPLDDGIVVVEVEKGERAMVDLDGVPASVRDRLGLEATGGLVQLFNRAQREWSAEVLSVAAERFDRRLVEEASKLRVEMAQGFAVLRQEMAEQRADLIKWAFLFWLGQVGATAALIAFMLRGIR